MENKTYGQKKETAAQLKRRIDNAVVFVPKDKDTKSVFFSDKGLRLTVTSDTAVVETGYHRHVFSSITNEGVSRPWLYVRNIIEIAEQYDCKTADGYSFAKLLDTLEEKDKEMRSVAVYTEWWLYNCFMPLYSIGELESNAFLVYEEYLHNIARNSILLSEKTEDLTNKKFFEELHSRIKEYTEDMEESVIFPKLTDEELLKENIEAIQEQETNDMMKAQADGNK